MYFFLHVMEIKKSFYILDRRDFLYLTELIHEILPQEPKDIYYSPAKFGQTASGKLYDAYNNLRKRLSQSGLLKRRVYVSKNNEGTFQQGNPTHVKTDLHTIMSSLWY